MEIDFSYVGILFARVLIIMIIVGLISSFIHYLNVGFAKIGKDIKLFFKNFLGFFKDIGWLIKINIMEKSVWYIAAIFLFLGATSMPSEYYFFMRIVVFCSCLYVMFINFINDRLPWVIAFAVICFVFNPILPIYLYDKTSWVIIDIVAAATFLYNSSIIHKKSS